ncbi:phosphoribosylformylglycinamidine synthase subunit PurS [Thermovorax subterraneus]|nr:phosphoribosylformylglycinamidine synthase subunit PurS [Thermovorax subterraneus]
MFNAKIWVRFKNGVLDPQGAAIKGALNHLGFEAEDVRVGKLIEVKLKADNLDEAKAKVRMMCEKLLANPVLEDFSFEVVEESI